MEIKYEELIEMQEWDLEKKIEHSKERIREWYEYWEGKVFVAFSGGKDSTIVLDLVRQLYPEVDAVFSDTGLEYPEVRNNVKKWDRVLWIRPVMSFQEVLKEYGYPVVSKETAKKLREARETRSSKLYEKRTNCETRFSIPKKWLYLLDAPFDISEKCCDVMKKSPSHAYVRSTGNKGCMLGLRADESRMRMFMYQNSGCHYFDEKSPRSYPIGIWTEEDTWKYVKKYKIELPSVYYNGNDRTGCMFCMFGVHMEEEPNRFQRMKKTHPKHYKFCIEKLKCGEILDYMGVPYK